ncbi:MAG: LamG-like jellyroll fold domain-containing protein [Patescibacteria group bacterium]
MVSRKGFGLIQALLAVALVSGAIFVFATLFNIIKLNKSGSLYSLAYKIAQEELEAVRTLPIESLTPRTNSDFINVIYSQGGMAAANDNDAPSAPNVMNISASSTLSLSVLPCECFSDFSFESYVKSSSTPQKIGLIFKAQDINNYYFFYLKSDRLTLEKKVNGVVSTLYQTFQAFNADQWYKIKISATGDSITLYLDDVNIGIAADNSLSSGSFALANMDTASNFDDVSLICGANSYFWNFDGTPEGEIPADWRRLGVNNLPAGRGTLSISEAYGSPNIKQIDINIYWTERGQDKTITVSTLKTQ